MLLSSTLSTGSPTKKPTPSLPPAKVVISEAAKHQEDRAELMQLIRRQAERIEKLKLDSAVQLEHRATLRRLELENLKEVTAREIASVTPQLEMVRAQWSQARDASSGYEVQWGSMRSQLQQMRSRVDALREQADSSTEKTERLRQSIKEMREQLHRMNRDKANLRQKVKNALEALVTDDEVFKTRHHEEELYRNQMAQAYASMRAEYAEAQRDCEEEFAPMRDDIKHLTQYLEEMQSRTKALEKYCIDGEMKLFQIERKWVEDVQSVFGSLERANQRVQIKGIVLSALEQQLSEMRNDPKIKPRSSNGHNDTLWLSNSLAVWETVVKKEINQQKQKLQMREDGAQLLSQTSQLAQRTRADLEALQQKVEGDGYERRTLLHEIADLHFLLQEKKINEEQMIHYVQDVCTQLDENLPMTLTYIRREGFDDYVSSTDDDEGEVDGFAALPEESMDDVMQIVSSLDLDPDDPQYHDRLRQMSHRPTGPLLDFARRKAEWLKDASRHSGDASGRKKTAPVTDTLDRAVTQVQQRLSSEAIAFVRNRHSQIQQGLLDPRNERLNADPKYVEHSRLFHNRVELFVSQQKEAPGSSRGALTYKKGSTPLLGASATPQRSAPSLHRIVIDGARVPPEVVRGNPLSKATYFTSNAVRGTQALVFARRTMTAQLRSIFVSRDLTRIIARRADSQATTSLELQGDEVTVLRIADITDIVLGHKTDVFREARLASKHAIREDVAFSILSSIGATLDIECDSVDDRNFWATMFAWVINESRSGGVLQVLQKAGKISVVDKLNQTPDNIEVLDRQNLQVRISA